MLPIDCRAGSLRSPGCPLMSATKDRSSFFDGSCPAQGPPLADVVGFFDQTLPHPEEPSSIRFNCHFAYEPRVNENDLRQIRE